MSKLTATRYHDVSCGHRVCNQGGKCENLHGHNYRIFFTLTSADSTLPLDTVGRVLDFSVIKSKLCMWLEENWDHKFLVFSDDPWAEHLIAIDKSVVVVPFNPTAENMAKYLVNVVGPAQLLGTACVLTDCSINETAKCSASYSL